MSHFSVAVIVDKDLALQKVYGVNDVIEEKMKPYQENNMGTTDAKYLKFHNSEEDEKNIEKYENGSQRYVITPEGDELLPWHSDLQNIVREELREKEEYLIVKSEDVIKFAEETEGYEVKDIPFKEKFDSFGDFLEGWMGIYYHTGMGAYGYWYNPNSKWDYWRIGGRFSGKLLVSKDEDTSFLDEVERDIAPPEGYVWSNMGRVKNINFEEIKKIKEEILEREWEKRQEIDETVKDLIYGMKEDDTKESYVKRMSKFRTHAVLDKDGNWIEQGEMGWWGIVVDEKEDRDEWTNNYKKRFVDLLEPEDILVVLDCHI